MAMTAATPGISAPNVYELPPKGGHDRRMSTPLDAPRVASITVPTAARSCGSPATKAIGHRRHCHVGLSWNVALATLEVPHVSDGSVINGSNSGPGLMEAGG